MSHTHLFMRLKIFYFCIWHRSNTSNGYAAIISFKMQMNKMQIIWKTINFEKSKIKLKQLLYISILHRIPIVLWFQFWYSNKVYVVAGANRNKYFIYFIGHACCLKCKRLKIIREDRHKSTTTTTTTLFMFKM